MNPLHRLTGSRILARSALSAILAASTLALVPTGSAQAVATDCDARMLCYWTGANYTESLVKGRHGAISNADLTRSWAEKKYCPQSSRNDCISSIYNRTSFRFCFYRNSYYHGRKIVVLPGHSIANLANKKMNNQISSLKKC